MARITGNVIADTKFKQLAAAWPDITFHLHRTIAHNGRRVLRWQFLNGQEIKLVSKEENPQDDLGRFLVGSYSSQKGTQLTSYPMNLFEEGRGLRSGEFEVGKYVITRKLKGVVNSSLLSWIGKFEVRTLQKEFDKV